MGGLPHPENPENHENLDDVLVVVGHPWGNIEVPLATWMATGPGLRPLVTTIAARSRRTGAALPLTVVPLRYRNDRFSRALITLGLLGDPWAGKRSGAPG